MSGVLALMTRCRELGAEFFPSPDGKLKVKAPAPLPDELRTELRRHKAEVIAALAAYQTPICACGCRKDVWQVNRGTCWARWVCRQCQDKVTMPTRHRCDPSLLLDKRCRGQQSTIWSCPQCTYAVRFEPSDEQLPTRFWQC